MLTFQTLSKFTWTFFSSIKFNSLFKIVPNCYRFNIYSQQLSCCNSSFMGCCKCRHRTSLAHSKWKFSVASFPSFKQITCAIIKSWMIQSQFECSQYWRVVLFGKINYHPQLVYIPSLHRQINVHKRRNHCNEEILLPFFFFLPRNIKLKTFLCPFSSLDNDLPSFFISCTWHRRQITFLTCHKH